MRSLQHKHTHTNHAHTSSYLTPVCKGINALKHDGNDVSALKEAKYEASSGLDNMYIFAENTGQYNRCWGKMYFGSYQSINVFVSQ